MEPTTERLELPPGYGRVTSTLAWATVRAALEQAPTYWVTTLRPDGRPHAVPVDGLWLDDVLYYGGSERTVHHRNAVADPRALVHLPDPARAVIVEGDVRLARPSPALARRLAEASRAKYGYGPEAQAGEGVLGLYPRRARAWTEFPADATRFRFG
jgi:hypothetical protein